jgi:hypothetical protein
MMYQIAAHRDEINRVAERFPGFAITVFAPVSLNSPKFDSPELGFLRLVSYLYVLYHEVGKVGAQFLQSRFDAYGVASGSNLGEHLALVRKLRTYLQHNLNPRQEHDKNIQEVCESWMRCSCGTPLPGTNEHWQTCLFALLAQALEFLGALLVTVRAIEVDESREEICRDWDVRIKRNHPPEAYDKLIAEVAGDMGRESLDPVRIRVRFYEQWEQELSFLKNEYDFVAEARKLIEQILLSSVTPVLPITGKDIMEAFGVAPGPRVGDLLGQARTIYDRKPCNRESLLEQLKSSEQSATEDSGGGEPRTM